MRVYTLTTTMGIALMAKDCGMPLREVKDKDYLATLKGLAIDDRVVELPTYGMVLDWLMEKTFFLNVVPQIDGSYGYVIHTWGDTIASEKEYDCPKDAIEEAIMLTLKWIGNAGK